MKMVNNENKTPLTSEEKKLSKGDIGKPKAFNTSST